MFFKEEKKCSVHVVKMLLKKRSKYLRKIIILLHAIEATLFFNNLFYFLISHAPERNYRANQYGWK